MCPLWHDLDRWQEHLQDLWQDYLLYLEDVEAFGWYMISDERKLAAYSRSVRRRLLFFPTFSRGQLFRPRKCAARTHTHSLTHSLTRT